MKWNYHRLTEEELEENLWKNTMAEDDPRYAIHVKCSQRFHAWRKEYVSWWRETYPESMIAYDDFCLRCRIWVLGSSWHPDSPHYREQ